VYSFLIRASFIYEKTILVHDQGVRMETDVE